MIKDYWKKLRPATIVVVLVLVVAIGSILTSFDISGAVVKAPACDDNIDNDGDGFCDLQGCYSGAKRNRRFLPGDPDCTTRFDSSEFSSCVPGLEVCDGRDNDCDGLIDEKLQRECGVGEEGACKLGVESCNRGLWGSCLGSVTPRAEKCNGVDDDCNGVIDDNWRVSCVTDEDCGLNGLTGKPFCGNDGNVHGRWKNNKCTFPKACNSRCQQSVFTTITEYCEKGCHLGRCLKN